MESFSICSEKVITWKQFSDILSADIPNQHLITGGPMMTNLHVLPEIASAAVALLSTSIPGLTPAILVNALENYNPNATSDKDSRPKKPLTRKEAADALGVSVQSVDRYVSSGRLIRVKYSARAIRISADSVYNLMKGGEL